MKTQTPLPVSKHFRLEVLAQGVYAAIHVDGGTAIGNAGSVDLGDRTVIFDSLFTPQAAADLRTAGEALSGRPIDAVINSHYHNDHIWGNQAFSPDTDIISTVETRRLILNTRGCDDYDAFLENPEADVEHTERLCQATKDEGELRQLRAWLDYHRSRVQAKSVLRVRPPNVTFTQRMAFHGAERSAELVCFDGGGHTASDSVLFLPEEGIVFMSDLLFSDMHPWLGSADPDRLYDILHEVSDLDPKILVPGHGPVGGPESLDAMQQYLGLLDVLARGMVESGEPEEKADELAIPEPFGDWLFSTSFPHCVRFFYQRRLGE